MDGGVARKENFGLEVMAQSKDYDSLKPSDTAFSNEVLRKLSTNG